jgi:hypothetical protein
VYYTYYITSKLPTHQPVLIGTNAVHWQVLQTSVQLTDALQPAEQIAQENSPQ